MSSLVARIATHRADALSRLLTQSRDRPNLTGLIGALASTAQSFEDLAYPVLGGRSLTQAIGAQLDGIGELVGQARNGQDDATYRLFLAGRIYANSSDSTTETLLALVRQLFGAPTAQVVSSFSAGYAHRTAPATLGFEVGSPSLSPSLFQAAISVLKDSMAAAVRLSFVSVFDATKSVALAGALEGAGLDGTNAPMGFANLIYSDAGA